MDAETLRSECPAYESCTYLNTGATGPSPRRVVEAVGEFERHHQFESPGGEGPYQAAFDQLAETREQVASLFGTDISRVALTRNTVEGINHVAGAIDWAEGDVVVRTDLEHPAGVLPWQRLRRERGISIRELSTEQGRLDLEEVRAAVEGARLVCLSSIVWNYGTRLPVSEVVDIAHDAGALVLVDAVQSVGQHPVDVESWGADFVAASGHKWLLGPWGSGMLYVAEPERFEPNRIGYFSVEMDGEREGYRFRPSARRFELGTTAVAAYAGLETAVETLRSVGLERVEGRIERLTGRLEAGLGDRLVSPAGARSGLVAFAADDPEELVERLSETGIEIRTIPEPHACRVSVHAVNTAEDVDHLLEVL